MNTTTESDRIPSHVRRHLLSHPRSGLSVSKYCEKHSISSWSFYQWRKRYQSQLHQAPAESRLSFTDLGVLEHSGCICEIGFPGGMRISIRRGIARDELAAILELIGEKAHSC